MNNRGFLVLMTGLLLLAGCTAAPSGQVDEVEEDVVLTPVPATLSFSAPIFD